MPRSAMMFGYRQNLLSPQMLYTTACCGEQPEGDGSFLPLQVHYSERFSSAGRTR